MPGEWQEPQRWVSFTRNRLQLKESRKCDAAVKWPRWLPCRHAPEKVLSLGPAVAFSLNSQGHRPLASTGGGANLRTFAMLGGGLTPLAKSSPL